MNQNLHVNKTNFHMKGFALGLALTQRRNATWKSPIITSPDINKNKRVVETAPLTFTEEWLLHVQKATHTPVKRDSMR